MKAAAPAPKRILIFCTRFGMGGIARHAKELGAWLRARGHTVSFAGTPGAWLNAELEPDFFEIDAASVSNIDSTSDLRSRLLALPKCVAALRRRLRAHPVDIIHAHESAPALLARLATLGMGVPIVLTFHGAEPERIGQYARLAQFSATRLISVSRRMVKVLKENGLREEKAAAIGLGVKVLPAPDPARVAETRAGLLGPDGAFLVVTVARISYQKGIDVLIDVAQRVSRTRPDIRFALVGDGAQSDEFVAAAAEAGVGDILHFVGRTEEPELYLRAADLFLLTSRWEALPYSIVEAFQAGLPAVATDCGGVRELIDQRVGAITPIGDVEALAQNVLDIAADPDLRARLGAAALARSGEDRFKTDYNYLQIEAVYDSLFPAAKRGAA